MYNAGNPMVVVHFRLQKDEKERLRELAREQGMALSDWLRDAVKRALESEGSK